MNESIPKGLGLRCYKCKEVMERRQHPPQWKKKGTGGYYTEWDVCKKCFRIQLYPEFHKYDR